MKHLIALLLISVMPVIAYAKPAKHDVETRPDMVTVEKAAKLNIILSDLSVSALEDDLTDRVNVNIERSQKDRPVVPLEYPLIDMPGEFELIGNLSPNSDLDKPRDDVLPTQNYFNNAHFEPVEADVALTLKSRF